MKGAPVFDPVAKPYARMSLHAERHWQQSAGTGKRSGMA